MHKDLSRLLEIASAPSRLIIGLMSGTSLDGLDIALCKFHGSGPGTKVELLQFKTVSYPQEVKSRLKPISSKQVVELQAVTLLNAWLGCYFADLINTALAEWNIRPGQVDLIASHGQTIFHAPFFQHQLTPYGNATLQIGDGDHIAVKTGIITLSDFRQKHIAAGGAGAPLALYGDYLLFSNPEEHRVLLNIGGIANFTWLPALQQKPEEGLLPKVFSTDTGSGNTLMDQYVQKHFPGKQYDEDAKIALSGQVHVDLLTRLLNLSFFKLEFPKTTGPEVFSLSHLEQVIEAVESQAQGVLAADAAQARIKAADVLATLAQFSAIGIVRALQATIPAGTAYKIYVSGGGMHNPLLIQNLEAQLGKKMESTALLDLNPDAKEAVLFALLANECISGPEINIDGQPAVAMGKISFPG
jgi:anhydro-N-acetylmuramic acid kinase